MATRNSRPGADRVPMDEAGRFVVSAELLADWQRIAGPRVDVKAEISRAQDWCAINLRRKTGDHAAFLRAWLQRAAGDAKQQPPTLAAIEGGAQAAGRGRAALSLVSAAPSVRS